MSVTCTFAVDPDLFTIFAYVIPAAAELKQIAPGVISCVCAPVVITSATTPEPGIGSTLICLDESAVLLDVSVYSVTPVSYTHLTLPTT